MSWHQDTTSLNLLWHIKMLNQEKKQCGCFFCLSASVYERKVFQCATHLVFFLSWMQINCRASRTKTGFYSVSPYTMWLLTYPRNKPCGKFFSDLRRINFPVSFAFHVLTLDAGRGASLVTWQPTWERQWSVQWDQSLIEMKERSDGTIVWERLPVKLDSNDF